MTIHESCVLLLPITVRAFTTCAATMPSADFCCVIKAPYDALSHDFVTRNRSPEVSSTAFRTTAGFTTSALDGYGLRCHWPTRPTLHASDPVFVHRLVRLLHASFRPRLATTPLRFAITSPPSGCEKDLHLRAVEHARHTKKRPVREDGPIHTQGFELSALPSENNDSARRAGPLPVLAPRLCASQLPGCPFWIRRASR